MKLIFKQFYLLSCVFSLAFILSLPAISEPSDNTGSQLPLFPELNETDLNIERTPPFAFLDKPQHIIASYFRNFVVKTDEFFANENVFYETSGSYIKWKGEAIYREGGEQGYYSDLKIKVKLPVTEKKLSLLVESNPGEEDDEIEKIIQDTPRKAVSEKNYFAGIQTTVGTKETWQFKPSMGIKVSRSPDYYTRFRLTRKVPFTDGAFQFKEALYWFDSSGWESDTSGEFSFLLLDNLLFRTTTGINWQEEPEEEALDDVTLRQIFSLTHKLSERRAISYQLRFDGIPEPAIHTTQYLLSAHYRQQIHSDYLFMDLIPQITYRKEHDFQADHSLIFRLEMVFKG